MQEREKKRREGESICVVMSNNQTLDVSQNVGATEGQTLHNLCHRTLFGV